MKDLAALGYPDLTNVSRKERIKFVFTHKDFYIGFGTGIFLGLILVGITIAFFILR